MKNLNEEELECLSDVPMEKTQLVVDDILNGVYDRKNIFPQSTPMSPIGVTLASVVSVEVAVNRAFALFEKHLPSIKTKTDREKLREALNKCVLEFEELQKMI